MFSWLRLCDQKVAANVSRALSFSLNLNGTSAESVGRFLEFASANPGAQAVYKISAVVHFSPQQLMRVSRVRFGMHGQGKKNVHYWTNVPILPYCACLAKRR